MVKVMYNDQLVYKEVIWAFFGIRDFCKAVPLLWNDIFKGIRITDKLYTFKLRLKTNFLHITIH